LGESPLVLPAPDSAFLHEPDQDPGESCLGEEYRVCLHGLSELGYRSGVVPPVRGEERNDGIATLASPADLRDVEDRGLGLHMLEGFRETHGLHLKSVGHLSDDEGELVQGRQDFVLVPAELDFHVPDPYFEVEWRPLHEITSDKINSNTFGLRI
jgi:hypothetical protein